MDFLQIVFLSFPKLWPPGENGKKEKNTGSVDTEEPPRGLEPRT